MRCAGHALNAAAVCPNVAFWQILLQKSVIVIAR